MNKFIIISNKSRNRLSTIMWLDLKNKQDCVVLPDAYNFTWFMYLFFRFYNSKKIRILFPFFTTYKFLFDKYYSLNKIKFTKKENYILIFESHSLLKYNIDYLKDLKISYNIKFVLILHDPFCKAIPQDKINILKLNIMDRVFSFDDSDCKHYGFYYFEQLYSKINIKKRFFPFYKYFDLYFAGRDKGRLNLIYNFLKYKDLDIFFRLSEIPRSSQILSKRIKYHHMISYSKIVKELVNANCILELLQEGQTGVTWRYIEAVCYNKKLLTNNRNIRNTKFYNPSFMKYINNAADIDEDMINWIKKKEKIDYHYDNCFSPIFLLQNIENSLK